jgi:hypothetical protein
MLSTHKVLKAAALAFVLILAGAVNGFSKSPQEPTFNKIPEGQKVEKFRGIVSKREPDSFMMGGTMGGAQTVVVLTPSTEVKSHKKGVFRGSKEYEASYILRGLRLEVDGVGNAQGQIVASKIRFDEQDLPAQALKATADPPEAEMRDNWPNSRRNRTPSLANLPRRKPLHEGSRMRKSAADRRSGE